MTEEEQNEAISAACGISYHRPSDQELRDGSYYQCEPNYVRDLNALHCAIMKQVELHGWEFQQAFSSLLTEVSMRRREGSNPTQKLFWCSNPTAPQRAEVLLRALNLWKN